MYLSSINFPSSKNAAKITTVKNNEKLNYLKVKFIVE